MRVYLLNPFFKQKKYNLHPFYKITYFYAMGENWVIFLIIYKNEFIYEDNS